ncbi:high-affinity Zn(2+) transporter zrt1 [Entomortierella beljakovae]|nr:high-affinity Zn(2+) transporter zrt1 [Entomortierella beljakovae]
MLPVLIQFSIHLGSFLTDECDGDSRDKVQYDPIIHLAGICIILVASSVGVFAPLMASRSQSAQISPRVMTLGKQFGTGIILATAFIHMMPTAVKNLSSPCLSPVFSEHYTAFGGLFILSSSLFMHWIEFVAVEHNQQRMNEAALEHGLEIDGKSVSMDLGGLGATGVAAAPCPGHTITVMDSTVCRKSSCPSVTASSLSDEALEGEDQCDSAHHSPSTSSDTSPIMKRTKSYGSIHDHVSIKAIRRHNDHHHHIHEIQHSHSHGLELLSDAQKKISTYILEAGVAAHSVIIGVSLGVSSGAGFIGLLSAMVFHQFFEGVALGARINDLEFEKTYTHYLLALIFSLTTPVGALIGMGISSIYNPMSSASILVEGTFDAISTGILLYMGYVNLLAVEFNMNGEIRKESNRVKFMCFLALWGGAAVMSLIGLFV